METCPEGNKGEVCLSLFGADPDRAACLALAIENISLLRAPNIDLARAGLLLLSPTRGAFDSAKSHKRQRRKRQSVTAKREKSQTPKFV